MLFMISLRDLCIVPCWRVTLSYYCEMLILLAGALPHSCCTDLLSDLSWLAPPIGLRRRREWVTVRFIRYSLFFGRLLLRCWFAEFAPGHVTVILFSNLGELVSVLV